MKKLIVIALVVMLLVAADLPPALPSSFYGEINGAGPGAVVTATVGGTTRSTTAFAWQGLTVYALDAEGGQTGQVVTCRVNGIIAGKGVYRTGTNQRANLTVTKPKSIYRRR